jgi:hypothetical protein
MTIEEEIGQLKKKHAPSYARGLVRLAKKTSDSREDIERILEAVNEIDDPYYRATSLASLALEIKTAGHENFEDIFKRAIENLKKVEPQWRRAEALEWVTGKMAKADLDDFGQALEVFGTVKGFQKSRDTARAVAKNMGKVGSEDMLGILGQATDDKERLDYLRIVANEISKKDAKDLVKLDAQVGNMQDPLMRGKAWGYLMLKMASRDKDMGFAYFESALEESKKIEKEAQRLELLNYVCDNMFQAGVDGLESLLKTGEDLQDNYIKARFLGHVAGKMSNIDQDMSVTVFDDALVSCSEISEPKDKAQALMNVAKGMRKSGLSKYNIALQLALECANEVKGEIGENMIKRIREEIIQETGIEAIPEPQLEEMIDEGSLDVDRILTLALFSTYEKRMISTAHTRAIARAAPLCWAYGLDLAIIRFPFSDAEQVIEHVIKDTSVGKGGEYLKKLQENGRLRVQDSVEGLGDMVATTSHPEKEKLVDLEDLAEMEQDMCFLLGVGKLGLPTKLLKQAEYQLEFTGRNIPLETCTAMGILSHLLGELRKL